MASSSDPEKDSNKSPSKPDNPFIKFRQFADQQISSLLQGIIGLPSAFSQRPSENPRWAVFDEDLRRRDELQARQQELKESEARKLDASKEEDIPLRYWPDWAAYARWLEDAPTPYQENDGMRDVPLYSSVAKSLFAHLDQPADGNTVDWKHRDMFPDVHSRPNPWLLRPSERSSNALKIVQHLIYNDLNKSSAFRSDYSILPYIMFSPYSPLRLIENTSRAPQYRERDTFPYIDAFQDLIRTTQPCPDPSPFAEKLFGRHRVQHYPDSDLPLFDPATRASLYFGWIRHLHQLFLLQESETRTVSFSDSPESSSISPDTSPQSTPDNRTNPKEAQSEQEMYEHFLRWATQSNEKLGAVAAEAKTMYADEVQSGQSPDIIQLLTKMLGTKNVRELFEEFDEMVDHGQLKQAPRKPAADKPSDDSKVVSERTITQRVKEIDGSVHTYVSICKIYADGREETTETSHIEEQERDEQGIAKPLVSIADQAKARLEKAKAEEETKAKNAAKKGWFWN
jgi:hypothetical protein